MMTQNNELAGQSGKKSANRVSADGKWRSFPRVPRLLQYVSSERYFARIKIKDKLIRRSLGTKVWTTAQLKLVDFLKERHTNGNEAEKPKFFSGMQPSCSGSVFNMIPP